MAVLTLYSVIEPVKYSTASSAVVHSSPLPEQDVELGIIATMVAATSRLFQVRVGVRLSSLVGRDKPTPARARVVARRWNFMLWLFYR